MLCPLFWQVAQQTTTPANWVSASPIDWPFVVSVALSVAGVLALVFSYMQIRESRKERAERAFRELASS
ncbi:MAG: hypothetical protein ABSA81_02935 [Candidatus Bathyarchaeia archaeon]